MLSPEVLAKIRHLELKADHLASDMLLGDYVSAFKGRGWDFEELREYVPGDDLRSIDWNVTARTSTPFVKVYREERDMTVMLMLDVSSSLYFSGQGRPKHELAAEFAAIVAFLATKHKDKIGLLIFSDTVEHYTPPSKGRRHVWDIIRRVLTHKAQGQKTDLEGALRYLLNIRKKRALVFLISDYYANYKPSLLRQLGSRHELICARLHDASEVTLPAAGIVAMEDKESGQKIYVNTDDMDFRKNWAITQKKAMDSWLQSVRVAGATALLLPTDLPAADSLQKFLRQRDVRRRSQR
ncbi:MAG: DUF58 domain-containing protein [Bdellovibrionota bacterium]|nr:MAG: DUF58 domain-containing protein [Pseudomonadota bacterium]